MWTSIADGLMTIAVVSSLGWLIVSVIWEVMSRLDDLEGTLFPKPWDWVTLNITKDPLKRKRFLAPYFLLEYWDRMEGGSGWEHYPSDPNKVADDMHWGFLVTGWVTSIVAAGLVVGVAKILTMIPPVFFLGAAVAAMPIVLFMLGRGYLRLKKKAAKATGK